jgi:NOL1/NOP2/fmu family ribosome biogenesis protein
LSPGSSRTRNVFEPLHRLEVTALWRERFGIPESAFDGYRFYRKAQSVWVVSDVDLPVLSYEALGMRMMDLKGRVWKPTTCALQIFGGLATKNVVHLNGDQARAFLAGGTQEIESATEPGYTVVFYMGEVLGCGLYSRGRLISQVPKEMRSAGCQEGE